MSVDIEELRRLLKNAELKLPLNTPGAKLPFYTTSTVYQTGRAMSVAEVFDVDAARLFVGAVNALPKLLEELEGLRHIEDLAGWVSEPVDVCDAKGDVAMEDLREALRRREEAGE
ncbi:MAG: hypothetical protein AAGE52_01485 [Myxococcota bacterium]